MQRRPVRIQWASDSNVNASLEALKANIKASLRTIYASIGQQFAVYNMNGAQAAQTTVQTANAGPMAFSTTDNMHSEMMAISHMLVSKEWTLVHGQAEARGAAIPPAAFTTTQPHCGFCTIMLATLRLPLSQPTRGNYNLAVNANYPIPPSMQMDNFVFVKLLNSGAYRHTFLKQWLNVFFSFPANSWVLEVAPGLLTDDNGQVEAENVGGRAIITYEDIRVHTNNFRILWAYIWGCLYEINNE